MARCVRSCCASALAVLLPICVYHAAMQTLLIYTVANDGGDNEAEYARRTVGTRGRSTTRGVSASTYPEALAAQASSDKEIILSLMDLATLPMALNLWETSLLPHNITHYLFLSSHPGACRELIQRHIPCYMYMEDAAGGKNSIYMSSDFLRKMNIRTHFILEALLLGYTVLHTDLDMVWFADPLPDVRTRCLSASPACDLAVLMDVNQVNAGFVYARATRPAVRLYREMSDAARDSPEVDDQTALNKLVENGRGWLRVVKLPRERYLCGRYYWQDAEREYHDHAPCPECLVVHNNFIVSLEAKVYRFREMYMWMYDDDHYYSNSSARYLVYDNVYVRSSNRLVGGEANALRCALALGHILSRVVILPRFHCLRMRNLAPRQCNLLNSYLIRELDAAFPDAYRENAFRIHPKVPAEVKRRPTRTFLIGNSQQKHLLHGFPPDDGVTLYTPADPKGGATVREVRERFGGINDTVLAFHSLYGALNFSDPHPVMTSLVARLNAGLIHGKYTQV